MDLKRTFSELFAQSQEHRQLPLVEAIAIWTENLRDAMSSATGLEQAVVLTANHVPEVLTMPIQRLVASLRYESLEIGLRRFADEVEHPTCDFVVAALVTASRHQTRDLGMLLTHLSDCARSECQLYLRIWVSRARSRTAVRIITSVVLVFVLGLVIFDSAYLAPFISVVGGTIAIVICAIFAGSLIWLMKIAEVQTPNRLFKTIGKTS